MGRIFTAPFSDIQCDGTKDTAKTLISIELANTALLRARLIELVIGGVPDTVADEQFLVQVMVIESSPSGSAGSATLTAGSIRRTNPNDDDPDCTVKTGYTTDPATYADYSDDEFGMNIRGTVVRNFEHSAYKPTIWQDMLLGIVVTPKTASNARAFAGSIKWEEQF